MQHPFLLLSYITVVCIGHLHANTNTHTQLTLNVLTQTISTHAVSTVTTSKHKTLRIAKIGYAIHSNPFIGKGTLSDEWRLSYESLFRASKTQPWILNALLCTELQFDSNANNLTVTLHNDAQFSNRNALTSHDVLASYRYLQNHQPRQHNLDLNDFDFSSPSPKTFTIHAKRAFTPETLKVLLELPITSKDCTLTHTCITSIPEGSGPFVLLKHNQNQGSIYRKNSHYWGNNIGQSLFYPPFTILEILYYRNEHTAFVDFQNQAFDLLTVRYREQWNTLLDLAQNKPNLKLHQLPYHYAPVAVGFYFNPNSQVLSSLELRKAFLDLFASMKLDSYLFKTELPPSIQRFINHPPIESRPDFQEPMTFSKAQEQLNATLERAGFKLKQGMRVRPELTPLQLNIIVPNNHVAKSAKAYASALRRLGIHVRVHKKPRRMWSALLEDQQYDIIFQHQQSLFSKPNLVALCDKWLKPGEAKLHPIFAYCTRTHPQARSHTKTPTSQEIESLLQQLYTNIPLWQDSYLNLAVWEEDSIALQYSHWWPL